MPLTGNNMSFYIIANIEFAIYADPPKCWRFCQVSSLQFTASFLAVLRRFETPFGSFSCSLSLKVFCLFVSACSAALGHAILASRLRLLGMLMAMLLQSLGMSPVQGLIGCGTTTTSYSCDENERSRWLVCACGWLQWEHFRLQRILGPEMLLLEDFYYNR